MKKYDIVDQVWVGAIFFAVGLVAGLIFGNLVGHWELRRECIQAGVAEWKADGKGSPEFAFKSMDALK